MADEFVYAPPRGRKWHVLNVLKTGEKGGTKNLHRHPFRPGRPRNIFCALLIDCEPDLFVAGLVPKGTYSTCCLHLGRQKSVDAAWDVAEAATATKH